MDQEMKISQLFEGPYFTDQTSKPVVKMDIYPSLSALQRECFFLGTLIKEDLEFNFWLNFNKKVAEVTIATKDDIGQDRHMVVTKLRFDNRANLPVKDELQVDTVYTHDDYKRLSLAMALYVVLCRYGYTIVSDFTQYRGGKGLWKKLAKESEARKFVVKVWSDEAGDWVKDSEGNPIHYTAENLEDEEVWKDISFHNEATALLVLTSE